VSLEQFDLQGDNVPMFGFAEGWHEPEYNPTAGLAWRWMGAQATLWLRVLPRDVTVIVRAESPLRYHDAPVRLTASIGGEEIARLEPVADFTWRIPVPRERLAAAAGALQIASDKFFVPGGPSGGDQRRLALRVYSVEVE
jgi:hypothetical protein